ncbi:MAG: metallophosphoesterase family protein [Elusimicrobiota bacterium]
MRLYLALLAAAPAWSAVVPVRFTALPPAPTAAYGAGQAAGLPTAALPTAAPLQVPVSAPLSASAPGIERIAVVGDAGTADSHQAHIAQAMTAEHERAPFASVLVLGDNVYQNGEPEKFDAAIREPYGPLFDGGVRFFPVLGNHDVRTGGGAAQRAYWGVPRWYRKSIGKVDVFALDTTVLLPHHQKNAYDADLPEAERLGREQLAWLDKALGESKADHVVVYGHHPMYVSTDENQKVEEAARLRALLEPILQKHGVKLYLAGHRHHYERSIPVGGVTHVISGSGGQLSGGDDDRHPSGVAAKVVQKRHFLMLEAGPDGLRVTAMDKRGGILDEFVVR